MPDKARKRCRGNKKKNRIKKGPETIPATANIGTAVISVRDLPPNTEIIIKVCSEATALTHLYQECGHCHRHSDAILRVGTQKYPISLTYGQHADRPTTSCSSSSGSSASTLPEVKYASLGLVFDLIGGKEQPIWVTMDLGARDVNLIADTLLAAFGVRSGPVRADQTPIGLGGNPIEPVGSARFSVKTECMPKWRELDFVVVKAQDIPGGDNVLLCREASWKLGHFIICPKCQE